MTKLKADTMLEHDYNEWVIMKVSIGVRGAKEFTDGKKKTNS
jgi:hypothetical protein